MLKKSKTNNTPKNDSGIQEIKYHFSWGMKVLLFFTFFFWIIPFIIISWISGKRIRDGLENIPTSGFSAKTNFDEIEINTLGFYNRDMELKKADHKLMISGAQWEKMNPEDIFIPTFDNVRLATFVFKAKKPTNKWVVVCHGWLQNRFSILNLVLPFYYANYNVLVYDARNHGNSTKTSCTFGLKESQDLFFVIKYLTEKIDLEITNKTITLIGNSMGATTILQALQTFDLTTLGVKCAIFDCGYDDFSKMLKLIGKYRIKLPWFWSYWGIKLNLLVKDGFNVEDIKPINNMKFCAKTPMLFIHGLVDKTVPVAMSKRLYEEKIKYEATEDNQGFSKLLLIPNAGHIQAITTDYDLYCEKTLKFINFWINK